MSRVERIKRQVSAGDYVVTDHAMKRLGERFIMEWQIVDGLADGIVLGEFARGTQRPTMEVEQRLADGTPCKAVWSLDTLDGLVRLVTIHFYDDED